MAIPNRFSAILLHCDSTHFFASRCGISGVSRPTILGIVQFAILDCMPWEKLNRGVSKPGGFPLFSGSVLIVSRTLSGLFVVGAVKKVEKEEKGKSGKFPKSPRTNRKNRESSKKGQKSGKKKEPKPNFLVRIFSSGVRVFHVNGWGPKSSICPSKPGKSNFLGGISRGRPKPRTSKIRKKLSGG